jgi:hypothetical protein
MNTAEQARVRAVTAYAVSQALAHQNDIAPELMDTLTGLDEAEVDASVLKAQRASAAIVARFQAQPDVAQVNVREGYGDPDRQIPDVSNWSMAEYARNRGRLGTAPQDTMSFLSGGK